VFSKQFRTARRAGFLDTLERNGLHELMARWGEEAAKGIADTAGGTEAGRTEAEALIEALIVECAFRVGRTVRALYPTAPSEPAGVATPPQPVHPRAEETSPAPEPAETPDAGKANPMPRTTAAAQGALDALAAEQAAKPKVYRHDEHMPAGGPRVTRIETEGERG